MARRSARQDAQHPKAKAKADVPIQTSDAGPVDTLSTETAAENSTNVSTEESGSAALMTGAATDRNKRQMDRALSETDQGADNISGDIQVSPLSFIRPRLYFPYIFPPCSTILEAWSFGRSKPVSGIFPFCN